MKPQHPLWEHINIHWTAASQPNPGAIESATQLLSLLKQRNRAFPTDSDRGYWPTVSFAWADSDIELEVFDGSFELQVHPETAQTKLFNVLEFDADNPEDLETLLEMIERHTGEAL
ncbi:hypothetical protein [Ascidiaceihabitans sp.]|uniref:hypothetical protein n=1 Tax=Ascidiaceihabitans sp. TaxID=1872644 RepID=UPI00329A4F1C